MKAMVSQLGPTDAKAGRTEPPADTLDRIDRQILRLLQKDGRLAISELARAVHLTTTPCYERVRRLERDGFIKGYTALVSAERLGLSLMVFVEVEVDRTTPDIMSAFEASVKCLDEVVECHMVAGGFDYLIKIRVAGMEAYRQFVATSLITIPGIKQTRTYIVMADVKTCSQVPI